MRATFDRDLATLTDEVLLLGSMVQHALMRSVDVLKQRDLGGAQEVIDADQSINRKRFEIENRALVLIATQQPMAGDLRTLAAILEIATELERMGDYAKGIARIALMMGDLPPLKPLVDIPLMAQKARDMLRQSLDAFVRSDVALARAIPSLDQEVDDLYNQVYRELLTYILADPKTIDRATYLLWVAHNLERTADRVTNICERVIFTVTGQMIEMDSEEQGYESLA